MIISAELVVRESYDAVIVGAGAAGLTCALALHDLGLTSVVLEKSDVVGGGTSLSAGLIWVGANFLAGAADSRAAVIEYLEYLGAGEIDHARMLALVDGAPRAIDLLRQAGMPFCATPSIPDHYYGLTPSATNGVRTLETALISGEELGEWADRILVPAGTPYRVSAEEFVSWGGMHTFAGWDSALMEERAKRDQRGLGVGLVSWLVRLASTRGIPIETGEAVDRLLETDGAVTGVALSNGRRINAHRGVVLASGGYESNPDLAAHYETLPDLQSMFPETITGDGLVMAAEIGAQTKLIRNNLAVFLGFSNPDEAAAGKRAVCRLSGIWELCLPHTIVVNAQGHRFADEAFFQGIVPSLRAFDIHKRLHSNLPCYLIFDEQFARTYSLAGRPPGAAVPEWVQRAPSPEELGRVIGVDPANLAATILRFNGFCESGFDTDFRRGQAKWKLSASADGNASLGSLVEPPFYGIRLHPTALSSAGLLADEKGRVRHVRGHPIGGLYAIGNAAAHTEYGAGYQAGISLSSAITFAVAAAADMAAAEEQDLRP